MQELYANNSLTTLGSGITASSTTLALALGTGAAFPNPAAGQFFRVSLTDQATQTVHEIMFCTARSGDTLTVTRAQEGTAALTWAAGDYAQNAPTAGMFANLVQSNEYNANDTGTSNAGVITLSPAPASLSAIQGIPINIVKVNSANTGPYTLNVNGLGAYPANLDGVALAAGQLLASEIFQVVWDGTQFELQSFPGAVTNAQLALMAAGTVKANATGSTGSPQDISLLALAALLGIGTGNIGSNTGYLEIPVIIAGATVTFIIQWQQGNLTTQSQAMTFPFAFPTACLSVLPSDSGINPTTWSADKTTYSKTGFGLHCGQSSGGAYVYYAIGY